VEFVSGLRRFGFGAPRLECQTVLAMGGGRKAEQRRRYREFVQEAVREGLERSPWEAVQEQVVLGGAEFLAGLRQHLEGDEQEQRGARRLLAERPGIEAVSVRWSG
jgi:hypothetical protein